MKAYQVQYCLPVENPENNIWLTRKKDVLHFEIPINHPLADSIGIRELLDLAKEKELSTLSTGLKNKNRQVPKNDIQ